MCRSYVLEALVALSYVHRSRESIPFSLSSALLPPPPSPAAKAHTLAELAEEARNLAEHVTGVRITASNVLAADVTALAAGKTARVISEEAARLGSVLPRWQDLAGHYQAVFGSGDGSGGVDWVTAGAFFGALWCDFTDGASFLNGALDLPPPPPSARAKAAAEAAAAREAAAKARAAGDEETAEAAERHAQALDPGVNITRPRLKVADADALRENAKKLEERKIGSTATREGVDAEGENADRNKEINDRLKRLYADGRGEHVVVVRCADGPTRALLPLVRVLFDPWSYSQTMENLFYFSYNVKRELAGLYYGLDGTPYMCHFDLSAEGVAGVDGAVARLEVPPSDPRYARAVSGPPADTTLVDVDTLRALREGGGGGRGGRGGSEKATALSISISPSTYRYLLKAYGIKEGDPATPPLLPHRASRDSLAPRGYSYAA